MSDFLTADLHNHHASIIQWASRPWKTKEEMQEGIIERWNFVVQPHDRVWILGDLAIDTPNFKKELEIMTKRLGICKELNGELHLVPGNHDLCHPGIRDKRKADTFKQVYLDAGIKEVHGLSVIVTTGDREGKPWRILLNHFPYSDAITPDARYPGLRPNREVFFNMPLAHGHVHQEWKQQGNMLNVGMDVWNYTPVSMDEVKALLLPFKTV